MRHLVGFALLILACGHGTVRERIEVTGPAVIGFVEDATHEDMERLNDRAIIQDDFVTAWGGFAEWAESAGIQARTAAPAFELRTRKGSRLVPFGPAGYVVVNSAGDSVILSGVRTDTDLQAEVCAFLETSSETIAACGGG